MSPVDVGERIAGGLLGVAAGDALGVTLEFSPAHARRAEPHQDITGGGPFGFGAGEGSDDSDLTWATIQAIIDAGDQPGRTIRFAADRMAAWLDTKPRDVGATTAAALRAYRAGGRLDASAAVAGEWGAGNGSLMRALPTGLVRTSLPARAAEARALSAITHADPRCTHSCVAYCELAAALVTGRPALDTIRALAADDTLRRDVRGALNLGTMATPGVLRPTGYVLDTLTVATWAVCHSASLEETLVAVVNLGGDADTTGAVAGGLLGVRDGVAAIPARWADRLDYTARFTEAARALEVLRQPRS
ncbi:MAG: ADP-ribosylglycohydrolase family protein [Actinomycetota bacterium]|nr:ADP-ribosylglycohydrolase family protein [Actinomycetota bacterium]